MHGPLNVKFLNMCVPRESFGRQKSDMKKVPYWVPKNAKRHHKRFRRLGDLANGIVQPWDVVFWRNVLCPYTRQKYLSGKKVHIFYFHSDPCEIIGSCRTSCDAVQPGPYTPHYTPPYARIRNWINFSALRKTMKELFAFRCSPTFVGSLLCLKVPSLRPLVLLVSGKMKMIMEQWRTYTDRRRQKFREKILPQCQFIRYKSHVNWPEREFVISRWEDSQLTAWSTSTASEDSL